MVTPIHNLQEINYLQSSETARIVPNPQSISDSIEREGGCFFQTIIESVINFFKYIFCCHRDEVENTVETSEDVSETEYRPSSSSSGAGHADYPTRIASLPEMSEHLLVELERDPHPSDVLDAFAMPLRGLIENANQDMDTIIGDEFSSRNGALEQYFFYITSNGEEYNFFDRLTGEQRVVIEQHWELRYERDETQLKNKHIFTARLE